MPLSASVMFACPWYQEAVDILRRNPQTSVGVHLTLNSEWKGYRWGPVLGKGAVPTLVDSVGYFHSSTAAFLAHIAGLAPGSLNLVVVHAARATPEMSVLVDMNNATQNTATGEPLMSRHRQAELEMLLSPELARLRESRAVALVTYADVIARQGRGAMRRPS